MKKAQRVATLLEQEQESEEAAMEAEGKLREAQCKAETADARSQAVAAMRKLAETKG